MASAIGAYLGDSLKVFLLPVSTIAGAADRNLSILNAGGVLVALTICAELLRIGIGFVPGGSVGTPSLLDLLLGGITYIGFFVFALFIMFALVVVFGGEGNLRKLFSAKLDLAAAIFGGFLIALVLKAVIATLYLGAKGGSAGLLIGMGEQLGLVTLGAIIGFYSVIVIRFGGGLSWPSAALAGTIHFALMVGTVAAFSYLVLQDDLSAVRQLLQG